LGSFTPDLNARYGAADSAEDYLEKSELAAYETHKSMWEGYGRNKYVSTGLIQWMLNNPFPEMIWHLYDYYFNPSSTYFATKRACEPLHIQYSYDDDSVWIVNSLYKPATGLRATAEVFSIDATLEFQRIFPVNLIGGDSSMFLFSLPHIDDISPTYFIRLRLENATNVLSRNFYWIPRVPDFLDWNRTTWFETPTLSYADLTQLQTLPKVDLIVESSTSHNGNTGETTTIVRILNPENTIALFIHVRVLSGAGADIWPIFWDDNYISLLPNEYITLTAKYMHSDGKGIQVLTEVWNNISGGKEK